MTSTLVVVRPFGAHAKGDVVSDPAAVAQILAGENAHCVVRVVASPAASSDVPASDVPASDVPVSSDVKGS